MKKAALGENFMKFTTNWMCWHFLTAKLRVLHHLQWFGYETKNFMVRNFFWSDPPGAPRGPTLGGTKMRPTIHVKFMAMDLPRARGLGRPVRTKFWSCNLSFSPELTVGLTNTNYFFRNFRFLSGGVSKRSRKILKFCFWHILTMDQMW